MNVISIVRVVVCAAALLFAILAMALPNWYDQEQPLPTGGTTKTNSGLWKSCIDGVCSFVQAIGTLLLIIGLLVTGSVLLLIGALACSILHVTNLVTNAVVLYGGGLLAGTAGVFQLIAFSAFAEYITVTEDDVLAGTGVNLSYGAAFALDIVGCVVSLVAMVLFLIPQFKVNQAN